MPGADLCGVEFDYLGSDLVLWEEMVGLEGCGVTVGVWGCVGRAGSRGDCWDTGMSLKSNPKLGEWEADRTLKIPNGKGITWPITTIGILAAILLAAGLLPPYYEIYIRRGRVVGINMWFLFIDACGAFFSLMSLVAQHEFDLLGSVQYSGCLALEIGIFCLWGADLGRRWWRVRKGLAAEEGEVVKGVGVRGSESGSEVDEEEVGGAVKKLDGGKSAKGTKGDDANV